MTFKVLKQLNPIFSIKTFMKNKCDLYMEEHLKILKMLRNKFVTVVNKDLKINGALRNKISFH